MSDASHTAQRPVKHISACETINEATGCRRYYLDGLRVSAAKFRAAKFMATLDSFITRRERGLVKHFCCVRQERAA